MTKKEITKNVNSVSEKKYLQKNEFKYVKSPAVLRPDGKGHVGYVSARRGHKAKVNIITHSKTFFGEPTFEMHKNPDRETTYKKPSRFSVPRWENDKHLKEPEAGYWKIDKKDRIAIKKVNKKYEKKRK